MDEIDFTKMRIGHRLERYEMEIRHRRDMIRYWDAIGRHDLAASAEKRIFDFELGMVVLQRELDEYS